MSVYLMLKMSSLVPAISRGDQEKIMWNFQGSWFLVEFPRGGTQCIPSFAANILTW